MDLETEPFSKFDLAQRLEDPQHEGLPAAVLGLLRPLSSSGELLVREVARRFRRMGPFVPLIAEFSVFATIDLNIEDIEDTKRLQQWLVCLPVNCASTVCVHWSHRNCALLTDWSTFRAVWNSLWHPFDVVEVFDEGLEWALLLGQEDVGWFMHRDPDYKPGADAKERP